MSRSKPYRAVRRPEDRVPMCPGCGLYPHTNNWEHRDDCSAEQTPEREALTNIAAVLGPHLTPQSAAFRADQINNLENTKEDSNDTFPR